MRDWRTLRGEVLDDEPVGTGVSPGKRTLTMGLPAVQRRAVQRSEDGDGDADGELDGAAAAQIAAEGTAGSGGPLPFLDRIQQSFGRHDVGGVTAHTGAGAERAAGALGAEAYAFGNAVAFAGAPSLHTAAHEAAHTVQQRAGVSVPGGVGAEGDAHERQADAVADRVVAGESAEALLDEIVGDGGEGEAAGEASSVAEPVLQSKARPVAPRRAVQARAVGAAFGDALATRFVQRRGRPPVRAVQRTSAGGVSVSNMQFAPREIKDDGATTTQATVAYSARRMAGPATLNWSFDGPAFGATVGANTGLITPGLDTVPIDKEKVVVKVKAVDSVQAGAHTTGRLTILNQKVIKAKADLKTFLGGTYKQLNYAQGLNGKFDATYSPSGRRLDIQVRVAFNFTDDLVGAKKWNATTKRAYIGKFMSQVRSAWSGQYQFQNVAEPKIVWKRLNPISVRVTPKEDTAAPHFTATVHKKQVVDNVLNPNADFSGGSSTPNQNPFPKTGAAELAALQAKTPTPTLFAAGSAAVGADLPKLQFLGSYLHAVHQPKFDLTVTGHVAPDPAAVTPPQIAAAARAATTLSRARAKAVRDAIRSAGGNERHSIAVVAKGNTAGVAAPGGDNVEIASAIDPSYTNVQPVLAHEFGHMLGLGDEYPGGARVVGGTATHHALAVTALGQDMADSFAKITVDSEGIMQGGRDVRPVHYVTLWAALGDAAKTAAAPVPAFKDVDWKFVGF